MSALLSKTLERFSSGHANGDAQRLSWWRNGIYFRDEHFIVVHDATDDSAGFLGFIAGFNVQCLQARVRRIYRSLLLSVACKCHKASHWGARRGVIAPLQRADALVS